MTTAPRPFYFPPPQGPDSQSMEERTRALADALAKQADLDVLDAQLNVNTQAIAELQNIAPASPVTAAFVADIQDMASAPRASLVGYVRTGSDGATLSCPVFSPPRVFGPSASPVTYTPIVADRKGFADKLRWIVGADTSIFQIDTYTMALCVYNPANGAIEKVWDSGNIKDGVANTTTLQEVQISMGLTTAQGTVTAGQILFVAHQQIAPGLLQGSRAFAAVPQSGVARPSSLLLNASCYVTADNLSGIPSTIQKSSLQAINTYIPWAAISVVTGVTT